MTISEAKQKLVDTALAEVGYREGGNNYTKYSDSPDIQRLYGWKPQNQPWCCTFVNWCFLTAFGYDLGSRLTYGGTAACANSAQLFKAAGAFVYFPQIGDQAFFYSGLGINHTGIVVSVDGTVFTTVEGNYSDKVSTVKHNMGASDVAGFGRPKWELVESQKEPILTSLPSNLQGNGKNEQNNDDIDHSLKLPLLSYSNKYSDACVFLQSILNLRHFPCGSCDGFFGEKTQAAVGEAQRYFGLTVDRVCGPQTWGKLLER